ncbi:MAG: Gfo/Idh/MocA family oxidoreductase [Clostridia bacterium]|nr:Gfo/Idh/MocA family oxidoreductase [Clostridia bacterium]
MQQNQKKHKLILIGAGGRGKTYTDVARDHLSEDFEVVAVAEPIESRRNYIKEKHGIPADLCFDTWEPLLEMPKMAEVAIIATMDRDHFAPAMKAIEKGYNLLLEKPATPTPEECIALQKAAEKKGVFVLICHVLRYTQFFMALKQIIDSGRLGEIMNIQHLEEVGNTHQSHSFVRGNWGNSERSSFMLLQKSCHDMDILAWLIGKKCTRVQSFGSLQHFTRANAPEGSPERCIDGCPHAEKCPYDAVKLYLKKKTDWFREAATQKVAPTDAEVEEALRTTQYGKCVYKCDNDVVDHQVVNVEFEGGVLVNFTMSAFSRGGRFIRIMGTKGELTANMSSPTIEIFDFEKHDREYIDLKGLNTVDSIVGGHGGGDTGIMLALRDMLNGVPNTSVCDIAESCRNHMIAFAAEESRLSGKVVSMADFEAKYAE